MKGQERKTWVQAIQIGDTAVVGVPAEFFTVLGIEIKRRSPFRYTYVFELANDYIGYIPDRRGHELGGYQTWTGLHSYAAPGTGEAIVAEALKLLDACTEKPRARRERHATGARRSRRPSDVPGRLGTWIDIMPNVSFAPRAASWGLLGLLALAGPCAGGGTAPGPAHAGRGARDAPPGGPRAEDRAGGRRAGRHQPGRDRLGRGRAGSSSPR